VSYGGGEREPRARTDQEQHVPHDDHDHAWPEATRECPQCAGAGCFPVGPVDRLSGYPDDVVECSLCETTGEVPESVAHEYGGDA
jgi:ferredoxin-like protein FixX